MVRKILGVIAGVITDFTVTIALTTVGVLFLFFYFGAQGVSQQNLRAVVDTFEHQPYMKTANTGLGCLGSLVGGFVAGWVAGSSRVLIGLITSVISCSLAILLPSHEPLWYLALGILLTVLMTITGAWLADMIFGRTARVSTR